MFGLTRDNVSGNALLVGVGIGCGLGSLLVPVLLRATGTMHDDFSWQTELHGDASAAAMLTNATLAGASNATLLAGVPAVAKRGYLSLYLSALRSFPSGSVYSDWCTLLVTALLLLALRLLYQWGWRPFEYRRGYAPDQRLAAAFLRSAGDIPPGYPNTWFKVADVRDIPSDYSKGAYRIDALGEALMLFRLPAAHLHAFESQGDADDLSEGRVVTLVESSLPAGCDPLKLADLPKARLAQRWCTKEINQMVFIWHHDDNDKAHAEQAQTEGGAEVTASESQRTAPRLALPDWEIPVIPGMEGWRFHGKVSHEIACHLQEIPENGADNAHLEYIHGDFLLSWLGKIIRHTWDGVWETQPAPLAHVAKLTLKQQVTVLGRRMPLTALDSNVLQVGPALVQLIFPTPLGKVAVIETVTPVYSTLQRAQNVLWAEPTVPRFMAKVFLMGLVVQFERDIPVWNFKHFLRRPLVLREDGPILKYRRWMRQFYTNEQYQAELERAGAGAMTFANE